MCSVAPREEGEGRRVTPSADGSTSATTTRSPSYAGTSSAAASSAYVTPILRPVSRPAASVVEGISGIPAPASRTAGVRITSPAARPGRSRRLLVVAAGRGQDECAAAERLPDRQLAGTTPDLAQDHGDLGEPEPLAAVLLGDREGQQPCRGEAGPVRVAVERLPDHVAHGRLRLGDFRTHGRALLGLLSGSGQTNCNLF